jgi:hypothetical protein
VRSTLHTVDGVDCIECHSVPRRYTSGSLPLDTRYITQHAPVYYTPHSTSSHTGVLHTGCYPSTALHTLSTTQYILKSTLRPRHGTLLDLSTPSLLHYTLYILKGTLHLQRYSIYLHRSYCSVRYSMRSTAQCTLTQYTLQSLLDSTHYRVY